MRKKNARTLFFWLLLRPGDTKEAKYVVYATVKNTNLNNQLNYQICIMIYHVLPSRTHYSFLSYSDEEKIPSRQTDKEKEKMLTCPQAAAESPGVNTRERE